VAGALAAAGQHEQAETVARSITRSDRQAWALRVVAGGLAEAGQHKQAETVACSISDPGWQAAALAAVSRVLVAKGDTRRAHHVASAACAVGRWTKVLGLVLSLESSAVRVLTEVK
jgi:hypothetical protein